MISLATEFREKGYVFIKNVLTPEEVKKYIRIIEAMPQLDESCDFKAFAIPDGITKLEEFWPIIFHKKLLHIIKDILGPDARYVQHTDIHHNLNTQMEFKGDHRFMSGWHRDTRYRGVHLEEKRLGNILRESNYC